MADAGARQFRARDFMADVVLGKQHAGDRHLAAADVGMRIDAAGHDDPAMQRVFLIDLRVRLGRDDAAILDEDVANFAVDAVCGVVDFAASELDEHSRSRYWA